MPRRRQLYSITLPADAGILVPGFWMLFALSPGGVPSLGATIQITPPVAG